MQRKRAKSFGFTVIERTKGFRSMWFGPEELAKVEYGEPSLEDNMGDQ